MKTTLRPRCVRRTASLTTWAAAVVADPAAHHATKREAAIVADLFAQLEASR